MEGFSNCWLRIEYYHGNRIMRSSRVVCWNKNDWYVQRVECKYIIVNLEALWYNLKYKVGWEMFIFSLWCIMIENNMKGDKKMLRIYLQTDDTSIIKFNDNWFDNYINNINFDDVVSNIIKSIDNVEYIGNYKVKSKFNNGASISVSELSTGCKTAINVYTFYDKMFTVSECGDNALQTIFMLERGNIYLPYFVIPREFNNAIEVIYDNTNRIVNNNTQLEELLCSFF